MTPYLIMAAIVIVLIGLGKGGLGGTLAVLATPLMATVMPATEVIGLLLPILMVADLFALWAHWNKWDKSQVLLLIPGGVIGVAVATLFLTSISAAGLRQFIGVIALLFVLYRLFEKRILRSIHYTSRNWHGLLAGGLSGISSTLAHTGPPPVVIYLMMVGLKPRPFVASMVLFFAILNWIKVPSYYFAGLFHMNQLLQIVWLLPLLPLSVWAGKVFASRVNKELFDWIIIAILTITAVMLLVQ